MDETYNWITNWANRKIKNNKNFKELITYEGVSLWWFVDMWLLENHASPTKVVSINQIISYLNDFNTKIENKTYEEIDLELREKFLKNINKKKTII